MSSKERVIGYLECLKDMARNGVFDSDALEPLLEDVIEKVEEIDINPEKGEQWRVTWD